MAELKALATQAGAYWVDRTNRALFARFFSDVEPRRVLIEITTQETVFAPDQAGLGFIRVQGFVVEHAAGPWPWEQVGAISTTRGHHWIIQDCAVRQVNGVGIDLGIQHPRWPQPPQVGFHIVRRNVVTDCGICGLCGLGPGRGREFGLLIEENVLMRNAWHDAERLWETGGIKTHQNVRCLIRRNLVVDTFHGSGIWMDWDNRHSRCCQNIVLRSRASNGGIFVEASPVPNLVDHNIVWETRGHGIYEHDSCRQLFVHNLVGRSTGSGFHLHGRITDRKVGGGAMTYGQHRVENNVLIGNGQLDDLRGEPSVSTNNLALPEGAKLDVETLELEIAQPAARVAAAALPGLTHDFFGQVRSGETVWPGPFAWLPPSPARLRLWPRPVPADTEPWLQERLEWFQDPKTSR